MTMKEFMNAVVKANISAELTAYATAEIEKIDNKNKARKTKQTATQKANAELLTSIIVEMTDGGLAESGYTTAGQVATVFGISTQKASAILQGGVKSGVLTSAEVKIKGKGKVIGYSAVISDTQTEEDSADESADSAE